MVQYEAHFGESGAYEGSLALAVAGFVPAADQWEARLKDGLSHGATSGI